MRSAASVVRRCSSTCRTRPPASRSTSTRIPPSRATSRPHSSAWWRTGGRGSTSSLARRTRRRTCGRAHGPECRHPASRRRHARARNVAGDLLLRVRRPARPSVHVTVLPVAPMAAPVEEGRGARAPDRLARLRRQRRRRGTTASSCSCAVGSPAIAFARG